MPLSLACRRDDNSSDIKLPTVDFCYNRRMKEGYQAHFEAVGELSESTRRSMAALYSRYYAGSSETLFRADLEHKTEALLVYAGAQLVGFTTQEIYRFIWRGQQLRVIYSGDTVVERAHWGQQALAFSWIERAGQLKQEKPEIPLYWFLIVKGHRTYRYLPAFSIEFYPHWAEHNADLKSLSDALALEKFGADYDPDKGILAFEPSRGHLREAYAYPAAGEQSRASVRFFLRRNPGYLLGHEMVCLCELSEQNLKPLTRRIFRRCGR